MKSIRTDISKRDKLYYSLDSYCRSVMRKSISYQVEAYSGYFGSITIEIVGKRAIGKKKIVVSYDKKDKQWVAVMDATEYYLQSLSEISTLVKSKVQQLASVVNKF